MAENDLRIAVYRSTDYKYHRDGERCALATRVDHQLDLFMPDKQPEVFEDRPSQGVCADPDEVRAEMLVLLAELRAAKTMPWTEDDVGFYQVVFPQMSNWLPKDEAAQLCLEFDAEMARLNVV